MAAHNMTVAASPVFAAGFSLGDVANAVSGAQGSNNKAAAAAPTTDAPKADAATAPAPKAAGVDKELEEKARKEHRAKVIEAIKQGQDVTIDFELTAAEAKALAAAGARVGQTPRAVVAGADITFAMLADPEAARVVCFGKDGVLAGTGPGHDYIDLSTVDDGLFLDGEAIAYLIDRVDGESWFAVLEMQRPPDAKRPHRDCSSLESGRRGCE